MLPKLPPITAPMNKDGANMPPAPPEPRVIPVATILKKMSASMIYDDAVPGQHLFDIRIAIA